MDKMKEKEIVEKTINKACEWLSKRVFDYDGNFLEDFKKAMKN